MTYNLKLSIGLAVCLLSAGLSSAATCPISLVGCTIPDTAGFSKQSLIFGTTDPGSAVSPFYQNPSVAATRLRGIDTTGTGMPLIHLNVNQTTLGTGLATYTIHIERATGFTLAGKHLFRLANTAAGLPTYVSSWTLVNNTILEIKIDTTGVFDLVFGQFPSSTPSGQVSLVANPELFDFAALPTQVDLSITGSGFRTANPLILATPVLAGSRTSLPVISTTYPAAGSAQLKSALATAAGIRSMGVSLKPNRYLSYYQRMVTADTASSLVERKAFSLNATSDSNLFNITLSTAAVTAEADVAVDANGGLSVPSLALRLSVAGWKALGQASRGIEVVVTVFDGGAVSRSKVFVTGKFRNEDLTSSDKSGTPYAQGQWNLFSYPWDEAAVDSVGRLAGDAKLVSSKFETVRYTGAGTNNGYEDLTEGNFSGYIDSGRAFWSGRRDQGYRPASAGGTSVDQKTFPLALMANQWNDFGIPFNFPVRLKDVIEASDTAAKGLAIWHFAIRSGVDGIKRGTWLSLPPDSTSSILFPWEGYTVRPAVSVTLNIPVRDTSRSVYRSSTPSAKTAASAPAWQANLWIQNQTALMRLQLAKGGQIYTVGEAPSVPGQNFSAAIRSSNGLRLSSVHEDAIQGTEGHWPLVVSAGKGFSGLNIRVGERTGEAVPLSLVETLQGTVVPLADNEVQLTAEALQQGDFHIVAGSPTYLQSFLKGVTSAHQLQLVNFPNPFLEGGTSIRFSLPNTFTEVSYQLRVINFEGRTVWTQAWKGGSVLNAHWDGRNISGERVPTGQYHLTVTAQVPGKPAFRAERNMVKLR